MYGQHFQQSMDQPGMVTNPDCGQPKIIFSLSPFAPENVVSRDGFSRPAPRQRARSPRSCSICLLSYGIPPAFHDGVHLLIPSTAIGSVPDLSGHAIAYR